MPRPDDLPYLLAEVRDLTNQYRCGQPEAFQAFASLVSRLLNLTVLAASGGLALHYETLASYVLAGRTLHEPLPLNDGNFLRMHMSLYIEQTLEGPRLKVKKATFQYQMDQGGDRWIFRYDYLRNPQCIHPPAHFQIRGDLREPGCLPQHTLLEHVHFPTGRFSLEAVIRLLADEFAVRCNTPEEVWRRVLDASEKAFFGIAHPPIGSP